MQSRTPYSCSFYHALPHLCSCIASGLLQAIDAVSRTLGSQLQQANPEISENIETSGRSLTDDEINFIVDFFQKEAAQLVVFARRRRSRIHSPGNE